MRKPVVLGLTLVLGLGLVAIPVRKAVAYWDWADEVTTMRVSVFHPSTPGTATLYGFFDDLGSSDIVPWSPLGAQSISGRFNAREQYQFDIQETAPSDCGTLSLSNSRWRDTTPPSMGAACNSSSATAGTFVGSVTYSYNTCGGGLNDATYAHRNRPQMDFGLEASIPVGSTVGYVSRGTLTGSMGLNVNVPMFNCFKIWWFSS